MAVNKDKGTSKENVSRIFRTYFVDPFCVQSEAGVTDEEFNLKGRYIFRGITNCKFGLTSGAAIRLRKATTTNNNYKQLEFINYHRNLIEQRKLLLSNSSEIKSDLEYLAEIQHHGGATCLIDFTHNYLVALFFASGNNEVIKESESLNDAQCAHKSDENRCQNCYLLSDSAQESHGAVFAIDLNDPKNERIVPLSKKHEKYYIEDVLKKRDAYTEKTRPRIWLWKPMKLNQRIVKQDSVFLFSLARAKNDENFEFLPIIVKNTDKPIVRDILNKMFNISENTIYDDLAGYSRIFNHKARQIDSSLIKHGSTCLSYSRKLLGEENHSASIYHLDNAIRCIQRKENICGFNCQEEQLCDIYFYKGLNLSKQDMKDEALHNYLVASEYFKGATEDRKLAVHNRIIGAAFRTSNPSFAFSYLKKILKEEENAVFHVLQFSLLEISIMTENFVEFVEIAVALIERYKDDPHVNVINLLKLYVLLGLTLLVWKTMESKDSEILLKGSIKNVNDLIKNIISYDEDETSPDRIRPKLDKMYSKGFMARLAEVDDVNLEEKLYLHRLNWEFQSISGYISKLEIDDSVRVFLLNEVKKAQDLDQRYFTDHVLSKEEF